MKVAIDTNVLIRMTALDDDHLVKKAITFIEKFSHKEIFVCYGALIEAFYVLKKYYTLPENQILNIFQDLMKIDQLSFENEISIRLAISKSLKGGSFNDALIGEIGSSRNLKTYSFDKGLKDNKSFEII